MRILKVEPELQPWPCRYPRHNMGVGIEKGCHQFLETHAEEIKSDRIYIPIYWTNNYYRQQHRQCESGFRALIEAQRVIDDLDPAEKYVTIVQNCEGIYEQLPANVTVFGAGGTGHVPLPLVCATHPQHECPEVCGKDLVASFLGALTPGGPLGKKQQSWRSGHNPMGIGTQIRQQMFHVFANMPEFVVQQGGGIAYIDSWHFCNLMYRSRYALAPRGYGRTSFRLYEAMQLGCIPVYIFDDPWLPYSDVLRWEDFAVFCHHENLPQLPAKLLGLDPKWHESAIAQLKQLVPDYFSLLGIYKQLPRMIEALDK